MIKDLTTGKPEKVLWQFSMPMFVSVIFQQLYNMADSAIAGKFAGENALAAVGASYPITMIFMAIAVGSNIGCSVVISKLFGGKKYRQMKTAITTTLLSAVVLSILLSVIGLFSSRLLMILVRTPANIFSAGDVYLKIYIGGFTFLFLYNIATGVFTSLGDSKTPLYYLIGSSLGNIALDYLFVAVFHWGVSGVAWATFIAQGVACILALLTLKKRVMAVETTKKPVVFSFSMLRRISLIAIPSILQQSFISVGNIFIQGMINGFGSAVIAGYSSAIKLNTFCITSLTTLGNALSSFTAQNMGAGKIHRVKKGFRTGIVMGLVVAVPFIFIFLLFGNTVMGLFLNDESRMAMETGRQFLLIVSPFYVVIATKLIADGVLRGSGLMKEFMISTFSDLILRVILAAVLSERLGTVGIWVSWPIGWTTAMILSLAFAAKKHFLTKKNKIYQ